MAAAHALHITEDHPFLDGDERPRRGPPRCPSRNGHRIADRGVELQRALADLAQGRRDNSP